MRVPDPVLDEVRARGFATFEGFLAAAELEAARKALWLHYPRPEDYFAAPGAHPHLARDPFSGLRRYPFQAWDLNRLAFHPHLVDAAERLLGTADLELYKGELWAKYAGAADYEQRLHRDYGNHSLVVPRRDARFLQMTTFILLSDVTELDAPTRLVPLDRSATVPFVPRQLEAGALAEHEVAAVGPAGSLLIYRTDVLHRGSDFGAPGRSRFTLLADYQARGAPWAGKMSWPGRALIPALGEVLVRASVRERDLFGFPPPGSEYWCEQTLDDVEARYPGIDLEPYRRPAVRRAATGPRG